MTIKDFKNLIEKYNLRDDDWINFGNTSEIEIDTENLALFKNSDRVYTTIGHYDFTIKPSFKLIKQLFEVIKKWKESQDRLLSYSISS
jgi:hypothetical protein